MMVAGMYQKTLTGQEDTSGQNPAVSATCYTPTSEHLLLYRLDSGQLNQNTEHSATSCFHSIPLGELPPPAPRVCFGRDEVVERVVQLAENLEPIALIGAGGGLGKLPSLSPSSTTIESKNGLARTFGSSVAISFPPHVLISSPASPKSLVRVSKTPKI